MNDRVQRVHEQIDRERLRRHSNRVLHGHPSPTLWDEPSVPVDDILKWRRHPRSGPRKDLLVYVGIPFCLPTAPDRCGFCLFPSEVYQGPEQLVTYLRYLRTEGDLYRGWFDDDEVRAVYFGGGTANLFAPEQYRALLDVISPRQRVALEFARAHGAVTRSLLAKACGISGELARRELQALVSLGLLRRGGAGRATRYGLS